MTLDEKLSFKWDFDFHPLYSPDIRSCDMALSQYWRLHNLVHCATMPRLSCLPASSRSSPVTEAKQNLGHCTSFLGLWWNCEKIMSQLPIFPQKTEMDLCHLTRFPEASRSLWNYSKGLYHLRIFSVFIGTIGFVLFCFWQRLFLFVSMFCLHVCMSTACIPSACERPKEGTGSPGIVGMDGCE